MYIIIIIFFFLSNEIEIDDYVTICKIFSDTDVWSLNTKYVVTKKKNTKQNKNTNDVLIGLVTF